MKCGWAIVGKNGNLLLSIPLLPDGTLDSREESILEDFTAWIAIHGEGIFGSRPWRTYGEDPTYAPAGQMRERDMTMCASGRWGPMRPRASEV